MLSCRLRKILKVCMILTLIGSLFILAAGLVLYFFLNILLDVYIDRFSKDLNVTRHVINSHESLVPSQDYLPEELDLGDWPRSTAMVVIAFGASLVLYSLFGLFAATSGKTDCLLVLTTIMAVSLMLQFLLFGCLTDMDCSLNIEMKDWLISSLYEHYQVGARTNNTFTFLMNSVMLTGQCCGIDGPADFLKMGNLNFSYSLEEKDYEVLVLFPLACCGRTYIHRGFKATLACAASRELSSINTVGCYEDVYEYIHDNYGFYLGAVIIFLIFWEVLQIFIGLMILFAPSQVEKDAISQVLRAAKMDELNDCDFYISEREDEQPMSWKSVFVPYAARSVSDVKPETTTQIW
ncbi:hypothetical protein BsWGS_28767 [Bradybaena similaris]